MFVYGIVRSDEHLGKPLTAENTLLAFRLETDSHCEDDDRMPIKLGQFRQDPEDSVGLLEITLKKTSFVAENSTYTLVIFTCSRDNLDLNPDYHQQGCMKLYKSTITSAIPCSDYMILYRGTIAELNELDTKAMNRSLKLN